MALSQSQSEARILLSTEELRDISLEISRGFAPRRFRTSGGRAATSGFSPQELLSISQQISREFAPRAVAAADRSASLVLLPVDPRHLHAYWRLDEPQAPPSTPNLPAEPSQPLTLRIYRQAEPVSAAVAEAEAEARPAWFDVAVAGASQQQQIVLPEAVVGAAGRYQAAIGRLDERREFTALAYSNPAATAATPVAAGEWLAPAIAQFIMPSSTTSSRLAANASGQHS